MATAKRVLVFAAYFYPHIGGYEKNVYELSRRLVQSGYKIDIVTCNTGGAKTHEEKDGILIHRLPSWNMLGGTYPIPKPSLMTYKIMRELLKQDFDLVNTQTRFFATSLLGLCYSSIKRRPLVHTERGTRHSALRNRFVESLGKMYDHTVGAWVVKSADKCVGVSESACDFLKHLGAKHAILIPNGIDTEVYKRVPTDLRKVLGIENAPVLVFVGRLIYSKGIQDLIDALPEIKKDVPNVKILIAGDGPYKLQLQKVVEARGYSEDIMFLGLKNQPQVIEILSVADVFVNPSCSEGLPTSVMEAAALGVPIVATNVGGTQEIIEHGKSGLLVPPGQPKAIAEAVSLLLGKRQVAQSDLGKRLGEEARNKVARDYSWGAILAKTGEVYQTL